MLVVENIFRLFLGLFLLVCVIFWCISHAPSKRNKNIKRYKERKRSTIGIIMVTIAILIFCGQFQMILSISTDILLLSLVLFHLIFNRIIENL